MEKAIPIEYDPAIRLWARLAVIEQCSLAILRWSFLNRCAQEDNARAEQPDQSGVITMKPTSHPDPTEQEQKKLTPEHWAVRFAAQAMKAVLTPTPTAWMFSLSWRRR